MYLIFFIALEQLETRRDKFESILEIKESVVSSPFIKAEADLDRIFCTVFETVCASSLAMCAYQIGEHLHLTFSGHLDLYSTRKSQFSISVRADPTCFLDR